MFEPALLHFGNRAILKHNCPADDQSASRQGAAAIVSHRQVTMHDMLSIRDYRLGLRV